jgi:hypothetical protein
LGRVANPSGRQADDLGGVTTQAGLQPAPTNIDRVRDLLATHPATRDRTTIAIPYRTDVYWCARTEG